MTLAVLFPVHEAANPKLGTAEILWKDMQRTLLASERSSMRIGRGLGW